MFTHLGGARSAFIFAVCALSFCTLAAATPIVISQTSDLARRPAAAGATQTTTDADLRGAAPFVSQPNTGNDGYFSDGVTGQFYNQLVADNFFVTEVKTLTAIRWWGASENFQTDDLTNMSSFTVRILVDNGSGLPGGDIGLWAFNTPDTNPQVSGRVVAGATEYEQYIEFEAPPILVPGSYWISISAILTNGMNDAWAWSTCGVLPDNACVGAVPDHRFLVQSPPHQGPWRYLPGDLAFELIPEPASAGLVVLVLAAALRRRSRRM